LGRIVTRKNHPTGEFVCNPAGSPGSGALSRALVIETLECQFRYVPEAMIHLNSARALEAPRPAEDYNAATAHVEVADYDVGQIDNLPLEFLHL